MSAPMNRPTIETTISARSDTVSTPWIRAKNCGHSPPARVNTAAMIAVPTKAFAMLGRS